MYASLDSTYASDIDVTSEMLFYTLLISSCSHSIFLKNDIPVTVMNVEPSLFDRITKHINYSSHKLTETYFLQHTHLIQSSCFKVTHTSQGSLT